MYDELLVLVTVSDELREIGGSSHVELPGRSASMTCGLVLRDPVISILSYAWFSTIFQWLQLGSE